MMFELGLGHIDAYTFTNMTERWACRITKLRVAQDIEHNNIENNLWTGRARILKHYLRPRVNMFLSLKLPHSHPFIKTSLPHLVYCASRMAPQL